MTDKVEIVYYGIEKSEGDKWVPWAIIGVVSDAKYGDVRAAMNQFDHLRIVPVGSKKLWKDVWSEGRILEFNMLLTAIEILCTK